MALTSPFQHRFVHYGQAAADHIARTRAVGNVICSRRAPIIKQPASKARRYAVHFAQFLRDNPLLAGGDTLGHLARAMDYADPARSGYWVGFFSYLELFIADGAAARPLFADLAAFEAGGVCVAGLRWFDKVFSEILK